VLAKRDDGLDPKDPVTSAINPETGLVSAVWRGNGQREQGEPISYGSKDLTGRFHAGQIIKNLPLL
jgi:hypothetical protein